MIESVTTLIVSEETSCDAIQARCAQGQNHATKESHPRKLHLCNRNSPTTPSPTPPGKIKLMGFFLSSVLRLVFTFSVLYISGLYVAFLLSIVPLIDPLPWVALACAVLFFSAAVASACLPPKWWKTLLLACFLVLAVGHGVARSGPKTEFERAQSQLSKMDGKTALVTGSTRGIGKFVAASLVDAGFTVFIHGRNPMDMKRAADEINKRSSPGKAVALDVGCDFSSFANTRTFAEAVRKTGTSISLLINNAAMLVADPPAKTKDGFDLMMQVNCIAPALLEKIISPKRVVHVSR